MHDDVNDILTRIKQTRPLILNLTNYVSMEFIANGLLSLGASPIMTESVEELDELVSIAQTLVINIGTLDDAFIKRANKACQLANELGKPIILDPVGAGASHYRTRTCLDLLETFEVAIIRGNASEIMALAGFCHETKGVDSNAATSVAIESAQLLSEKYCATVAISGETDAVINNKTVQLLTHGSPLMPMITGSGCLLTAVVAAFSAVHPHHHDATSAAIFFYGICGEIAARHTTSPGSFKTHFIDALSLLLQSDPKNA